jgi:hypothetical protein
MIPWLLLPSDARTEQFSPNRSMTSVTIQETSFLETRASAFIFGDQR